MDGEASTVTVTVLDDQAETWSDATKTLPEAADTISEARVLDGPHEDLVVDDLRGLGYELIAADELHPACACLALDGRSLPLRKSALAQLATHIGATSRFLLRMPTDLHLKVVRWGISAIPDAHRGGMLRLAGGQVRGLVSARYGVLDGPESFAHVTNALMDLGLAERAQVGSVATGLTLLVRCLWHEDGDLAADGSKLSIGIDVSNGETGNRALALHPVVYHRRRAAASRRGTWRRRHLGTPETIREDLIEAIPNCLAEARKMRDLVMRAPQKLVDDALAESEALRGYGLTIAEAREVVRRLMSDRSVELPADTAEWPDALRQVEALTVFDVWCAIVESAKSARNTDVRLNVEEVATKYLTARTK